MFIDWSLTDFLPKHAFMNAEILASEFLEIQVLIRGYLLHLQLKQFHSLNLEFIHVSGGLKFREGLVRNTRFFIRNLL